MKLTLNLASRTCINRRAVYFGYAAATTLLVLALAYQITSALAVQRLSGQIRTDLAALETAAGTQEKPPEISPERRQKLQEEITFANHLIEKDGFRWTALLGRLEAVAVEGISLRSVQPDFKQKSLRLTGAARGVPQLQAYLDRLIASPDFAQVYLLNQATIPHEDERRGGPPPVSFSLTVNGGF